MQGVLDISLLRVYARSMTAADPFWRVASECTAAKLRRASRSVANAFDRALSPSGIRSTQFSLLVKIHLVGKMSLTGLASKAGLDRTTLTRNIDPLLRERLVREVPEEIDASPQRGKVRFTRRSPACVSARSPTWPSEPSSREWEKSAGPGSSRSFNPSRL